MAQLMSNKDLIEAALEISQEFVNSFIVNLFSKIMPKFCQLGIMSQNTITSLEH